MKPEYRVAGYVKLAKLWERSRDAALQYHRRYYENKYADSETFKLVDVYVDITGQKAICKRPAMLRLMRDCFLGNIDCIAAQTKGYLAANTREFCYLIKFLFDADERIDIITEDEMFNINTLVNMEQQREALHRMANEYVALNPDDYKRWEHDIVQGMKKLLIDDMEGGCVN